MFFCLTTTISPVVSQVVDVYGMSVVKRKTLVSFSLGVALPRLTTSEVVHVYRGTLVFFSLCIALSRLTTSEVIPAYRGGGYGSRPSLGGT